MRQPRGSRATSCRSARSISGRTRPCTGCTPSRSARRRAPRYGPSTEPLGKGRGAPVLLGPPIGYEYMRCQFMLRTLAERLAEAGVPSLRFDFFGMADSLGDDMEASFARWGRDLEAALEL